MRFIFFFILILNACEILSQTSWEIYSTINEVEEIGFNDDMVYVCHRGGFAIIDQITGQEIIYNTGNSSLQGTGTAELEILSNGDMWLSLIHI